MQKMTRVEVMRLTRRQHGVEVHVRHIVTVYHWTKEPAYSSSCTGSMETADWPVPSKPRRTTATRRGRDTGAWVENEKEGMFLGVWRWEERGSLAVAEEMRRRRRRRRRGVKTEDGIVL